MNHVGLSALCSSKDAVLVGTDGRLRAGSQHVYLCTTDGTLSHEYGDVRTGGMRANGGLGFTAVPLSHANLLPRGHRRMRFSSHRYWYHDYCGKPSSWNPYA